MYGRVATGEGHAARFVPAIADDIVATAGFEPHPGTLNLHGVSVADDLPIDRIEDPSAAMDNCDGVRLRRCTIGGIRAAILTPLVRDYPEDKTELVAPAHLRSLFDLRDGDTLRLSDPSVFWHPAGPTVTPAELSQFDSVVFDLDGTLVDLAVDWPAVREELEALFDADPFAVDTPLGEFARDRGQYEEYCQLLETHEVAGAERATALPPLGVLDAIECPVGICTKNATRAAETALERFNALESVDAVVARETTIEQKPDPTPLTACLDRLGGEVGNAVFVGDERDDCDAAARAGTNFLHVEQLPQKGQRGGSVHDS